VKRTGGQESSVVHRTALVTGGPVLPLYRTVTWPATQTFAGPQPVEIAPTRKQPYWEIEYGGLLSTSASSSAAVPVDDSSLTMFPTDPPPISQRTLFSHRRRGQRQHTHAERHGLSDAVVQRSRGPADGGEPDRNADGTATHSGNPMETGTFPISSSVPISTNHQQSEKEAGVSWKRRSRNGVARLQPLDGPGVAAGLATVRIRRDRP
jgi:hypothetical protein